MAKTSGQAVSSAAAGLDALLQANAQAAQLWLDTWRGTAVELGNFATKRWTRDVELACRLCACRTPVDVFGLQADFVNQALQEYMDEATRLMATDGHAVRRPRRTTDGASASGETASAD